jgi:hypothetical protein
MEEEKELTGVLTEEHGGRPWRRHDSAAMVVAARPPSRSCTGEGAASCSRPSGQAHHSGDVGVAAAVQPTRRQGEHRKHRRARAGAPARLAGVDQAAWARSTGAELGGDGGDWRRSRQNPTVRRKRTTRQSRCARGRRQISPELAGAGRGARRRLGSPGEKLGLEPNKRGESEGAAGLGQAGSVKPTWVD